MSKADYYREWAARNKDHRREYQRAYRKKNAERLAEQKREYRAKNAATIKARKAAYYQANKERIAHERRTRDREARIAQARAWVERNPERRAAIARRDKARRRQAPFTPMGEEYAEILLRDPCSYCGQPAEAVDHIDPIARGGDSDWENLTAACTSCNSSKHARPLLDFLLIRPTQIHDVAA